MRFLVAALMGFVTGYVVMTSPANIATATATALIVAIVLFNESVILSKLEALEKRQ